MRCVLSLMMVGGLLCGGFAAAQEKVLAAPKAKAAPKAAADAELDAKLDVRMKADFVDVPVKEALQMISDAVDLDVVVDRSAEDFGLTSDQTVNLTITKREVKARTVLDLILRSMSNELDYVVRDGVLLITSSEQSFTTLVYQVGPLTAARDRDASGVETSNMTAGETQLLDVIQQTVQPNTWAESGGAASAKILNGLLVVKAGSKAQLEIRELLEKMMQAQKNGG